MKRSLKGRKGYGKRALQGDSAVEPIAKLEPRHIDPVTSVAVNVYPLDPTTGSTTHFEPERFELTNTIERQVVLWFGCFIALLIVLAAYFTDNRGVDIDELVMFSPAYTLSHYGTLAHPVEGFYNAPVIVHPPLHYGLVGLLLRAGLTWYYAGGTPVAFMLLLASWVIMRGTFPVLIKLALLFGVGVFAAANFIVSPFGIRPDAATHATWFAGLLLLESARLNKWSPVGLFLGAFLVTWASCIHYYATAAVFGVAVYIVWPVWVSGWRAARRSVLALTGGVLAFGIPYVVFFLAPYWKPVVNTIRVVGFSNPTGISSLQQHLTIYKGWAHLAGLPLLLSSFFALGVPLVLFSTAILAGVRHTRGIALAAVPLQLGILFFAPHKRAVYLVHEVELFVVAVTVAVVVCVSWLARHPRMPSWGRSTAVVVVALLLGIYLIVMSKQLAPPPIFSTQPQIHEADIARAATRTILGPNARTTGRIGAWYSGGGDYWHDLLNDLTYTVSADPASYLARFDAAVDYPFRSGENPPGTQRTPSYWYRTGQLKLRGFYISDRNLQLRIVLLSPGGVPRISGYALLQGHLHRFEQSESGQYEVITAACPALPELDPAHFALAYPHASMVPLELPPDEKEHHPGLILTVLTQTGEPEPAEFLRRSCAEVGRHRLQETPVDKGALVDTLRRTDSKIRFVHFWRDVPAARP